MNPSHAKYTTTTSKHANNGIPTHSSSATLLTATSSTAGLKMARTRSTSSRKVNSTAKKSTTNQTSTPLSIADLSFPPQTTTPTSNSNPIPKQTLFTPTSPAAPTPFTTPHDDDVDMPIRPAQNQNVQNDDNFNNGKVFHHQNTSPIKTHHHNHASIFSTNPSIDNVDVMINLHHFHNKKLSSSFLPRTFIPSDMHHQFHISDIVTANVMTHTFYPSPKKLPSDRLKNRQKTVEQANSSITIDVMEQFHLTKTRHNFKSSRSAAKSESSSDCPTSSQISCVNADGRTNLKALLDIASIPPEQLKNKRVLLNTDFSSVSEMTEMNTEISSELQNSPQYKFISESIPTIQYLLECGAQIVIISSISPQHDLNIAKPSLRPIATMLSTFFNKKVVFCRENTGVNVKECVNNVNNTLIVLENLAHNAYEINNNEYFTQAMVNSIKPHLFVMDNLHTMFQKTASSQYLTKQLANEHVLCVGGFNMMKELENLHTFSHIDQNPVTM